MRGLAAITLLFSSIGYLTHPLWGFLAIDVFFCLSAFLLTINFYKISAIYLNENRCIKDWALMLASYFTRRFLRVYPLFIIVGCTAALFFSGKKTNNKQKKFNLYMNRSNRNSIPWKTIRLN